MASAVAVNNVDRADEGPKMSSVYTTFIQAERFLITRVTILSVATEMYSPDNAVVSAAAPNLSDGADEGSTMSISVKTYPRAVEGLSIIIFTILKIKSNQIKLNQYSQWC